MHGVGVTNKMQNVISFLKDKVVHKCDLRCLSSMVPRKLPSALPHRAALAWEFPLEAYGS